LNSYTGLHARAYDDLYATKPYADEARFVHELAGSPGGTLLEVACGTGRHARAFADLGYDVTGTDINDELLEIARTQDDRVRFVQGDMVALSIDGGPFDLVTCLFDSIGYPLEDEQIVSALHSLGRHTRGTVVCEFLHASALITRSSPVRVKRIGLQDGRSLTRISETELDVERMRMTVRFDLIVEAADGACERWQEEQTNRMFTAPEIRLLAERAELSVKDIVPAYSRGLISGDTFHLLLVATPT
jgi:SAM-dependent methyltransferase